MNYNTRRLKGSPSRDAFKKWHKTLDKTFYASDLDLVLVDKKRGIIAALDFKTGDDSVTFSEVVLYNALAEKGIPVFIVKCAVWQGDNAFTDIDIERYVSGDLAFPPNVVTEVVATGLDAKGFENWERGIREGPGF